MDSIENGATIRIGLEEKFVFDSEEEKHLRFFVQAYSLKINKKTVFSFKGGGDYFGRLTKDNQTWIKPYHEENAIQIAEIMKKNNVRNYIIYNGEMIESPGNQWTSCDYLPESVEELFKKTLEENLGIKPEN